MRFHLPGILALVLAASPAAAQTCGDYVREPPEQCDDGNTRNLDGCDASCRFEQTQRINDLRLEFAPAPGVCANNAFGGAIVDFGQLVVLNALAEDVRNGFTSILFHLLGLDDPVAGDDPDVTVGVANARPVPSATPGAYDGRTSVDWWYAVDPGALDADRLPVERLPGSIGGGVLRAGPGRAVLALRVSGHPRGFALSDLHLAAPIGATSTPLVSAGASPGHEAIEHLDPALQAPAGMGASDPDRGTLCGNLSAASLAQAPVPQILLTLFPCMEGYTAANSFLDMVVGGCTFPPETLYGSVVLATQPDTAAADTPLAGSGPPYTLTAGADYRVNGCLDHSGSPVPLPTCLASAAYSSYFTFTTHRVVAADDLILEDGFESGTLAQWSGAATDGGDLTVGAPAIVGAEALRGEVDDTAALYVQDDRPDQESRYRGRFHVDPSAFDPGEANARFRARVFIAFEEAPTRRLLAIVLRRLGGEYSLRARVRQDDDSQAETPFVALTAAPHRVEFEWIRASGPDAEDGRFRLWLDGAPAGELTGLDNSRAGIDFARMGALSVKPGASGTLRWDEFKATRRSP
jgi:cysteine-rich repeat protein